MTEESDSILVERQRIQAEYCRREREIDPDTYAPWQPAEMLAKAERKRTAAALLRQSDSFPKPGYQCLEVGYGKLGWLGDLIDWGVRETDLHGIELSAARAAQAHEALPSADLKVGDASALPWADKTFHLVVVSTVFSSILSNDTRARVAQEIGRVLMPGGALIWYDLSVNNPRNRQVRGIGRKELRRLFPQLSGRLHSVTLAPPLARLVAPRSWTLATLLQAMPMLRTHLLGVLKKAR